MILKTVLGIAVVTVIFILSPVRDQGKVAPVAVDPPSGSEGAPSNMLSSLAAQIPAAMSRSSGAGAGHAAQAALAVAGAASGLESVRRIVIPPPPVPVEMPPLRR